MPELPEVQTVANDLIRAGLIGRTITAATVSWPRTIAAMPADRFSSTITGHTIVAVRRRGKFLILELSGGLALLIHLRMSGRLNLEKAGRPRSKHEHVIIELDGRDELRFHDTRKFGRVYLTDDPMSIVGKLGLEPLDPQFSLAKLEMAIAGRNRQIKPLLLDQTVIAGLGNIYVDEALWEAGIHPTRNAASLSTAEIAALHRSIPKVLRKGLKNMGTSLGSGQGNFYSVAGRRGRNADRLNVFRRTGEACPRCGKTVERLIVGQRSTHICPGCQKWRE